MNDSDNIGRARTVLVFGDGDDAAAVTTNMIARGVPVRRRTRPHFAGAALFDDALKRHIEQIILPIVDGVGDLLKVPRCRFEISAANVGAASSSDTGIRISGFSADVPLFLALLSARLQMPLAGGIASTGHIASPDGDIRWVRHLPAKLHAATNDASVGLFLCPALDTDDSVNALAPRERSRSKAAMAEAKQSFRVVEVSSVEGLVREAFRDEDIVAAALATGFWGAVLGKSCTEGVRHKMAKHLATSHEDRFWRVLEANMLESLSEQARDALAAYTTYFVVHSTYPPFFGQRLRRLILSLSPSLRKSLLEQPAVSVTTCIRLSQFARESDYPDVQALYKIAEMDSRAVVRSAPPFTAKPSSANIDGMVTSVLNAMSATAVAAKIGLPIDSARAAYFIESVTVRDEEFLPVVEAFYLHLLRHVGQVEGKVADGAVGPEALALLDRAFADRGGVKMARMEAIDGVHGGVRYVLDRLTDQFKREQAEQYISYVLNQTVEPLEWDARSAFVLALFKRMNDVLPPDTDIGNPARYADALSAIVRAWSRSGEPLRLLIRSI